MFKLLVILFVIKLYARNDIFNIKTLIQYVKKEKYTNFGYRAFKYFLPSSNLFRRQKSDFIKSIKQIVQAVRNNN